MACTSPMLFSAFVIDMKYLTRTYDMRKHSYQIVQSCQKSMRVETDAANI